MDEKSKQELLELSNLEAAGTLDDSGKSRLELLHQIEQVEKTTEERKNKEFASALAQKEHFREKAEKAESERKALEAKLNGENGAKASLDVGDYIDISASLEGLDQREKQYLAEQHKLTGKPLQEIRKSEDFGFWDSAYRAKVEKEQKTLKPNATQTTEPKEQNWDDKLNAASLEEKEKILAEAGLYKAPKPKLDRANIGTQR